MTGSRSNELLAETDTAASRPAETLSVSVVIPCYNEEHFIGEVLDKLADQYERDRFEIIVVDGLSRDQTRNVVAEFKQKVPGLSVSLIDNPARNIPVALNLGIAAARGNIIARMDAHAAPSSDYIRRCVEVLGQDNAGIVGMPCRVRPGASSQVAAAIASAVSHPFGIGDAKYRLSEAGPLQQPVDTVAFACFRKSLWQALGGFNESLLTNEDYDFNYRARLSGEQVILDRSSHCDYFARTRLRDLAAQYWRYGGWKAQMVKLHPRSLKMRHLVAPTFVLSLVLLTLLSVLWTLPLIVLAAEVSIYALLSLLFGLQVMVGNKGSISMPFLMPAAFLTIHMTWGASFLLGLLRRPR
jgi:glycosyltransferase involved in cell wall biosynthesis